MQYDGSSVMAVFETIARSGEISRAEISRLTGFSQVTVGRAVELFDACGIITQYKAERASAGRKTGICRLERSFAMLIYDFEAGFLRVADLSLNVLAQIPLPAPENMLADGFGCFAQTVGGELMGIACIVPARTEETAAELAACFGQPQELITEAPRAAAIANAARFDVPGAALFLRAGEKIDGALMLDGRLHTGAGGMAGDFSKWIPDAALLPEKLAEIAALLDPALVHIIGENLPPIALPEQTMLVIEPPAACRDAADGAAMLLREKWLRLKLAEVG